MKKIISIFIVFSMFLSMGAVAFANDLKDDSTIVGQLSIQSYREYLIKRSKNEPQALDILNKFDSLEEVKQQDFINVLQSPELAKNLKPENRIYMINGVPVENIISPSFVFSKIRTAQWGQRIYGIDTTMFYLTVDFEYGGSNASVTNFRDATGSHVNWNPGLILSENGVATKQITGDGYAQSHQTWTARYTAAGGFASTTEHVYVKANGYYGYTKFETTRSVGPAPGMGGWNLFYNESGSNA
ncbi:hypothetical protein [Paenibacillus chitinolyticus]|uniref:hypothetical protein n=1 Tax=Paenibacillus chitinolyticus TaxID=79263 RepID=UPI00362975A9